MSNLEAIRPLRLGCFQTTGRVGFQGWHKGVFTRENVDFFGQDSGTSDRVLHTWS